MPGAAQDAVLTDQQVGAVLGSVPGNIARLRCGPAQCEPATLADVKTPPVPVPVARTVISRGFVSGLGQHCQPDCVARSFQAMVASYRRERQMAMIGALHGFGMSEASRRFQGQACPDMMRSALEGRLDYKR
jgi:hypothetical protein